ncbi:sulfotransferase family 2 domain-containing protein [Nocardioides sp. cx-173]|uniref:sulfotransferase family 2 domain-containing protein n=1 Tax=Nocardioides sp. cx-173 TaxID=2898796 RepID=UPI001E5B9F18|nr:sulfotransferase family 2 domain-containing protein [Nocardioides sp. cx-173]MCD4525801.1 sulfotransferase family protein [Nocardioides sp. cx-173]UGB39956.1 sulfotransferase family protein [Nocardioides sp. cx-173]
MPIFLRGGRAVLFVHVPKTGGTSIERVFERAGWSTYLLETPDTERELVAVRKCSPQHYHAELLRALLRLGRFEATFMMVRDPLARFRSEFLMRHSREPRTSAADVEEWADRLLRRYRSNPFVLDNHVRPQSEFHLKGATVYRLEDGVDSMVGDLNARLGLDLDPAVPHTMHGTQRAGLPSSAVELSPALVDRLSDFYASDFELFGYPRPVP